MVHDNFNFLLKSVEKASIQMFQICTVMIWNNSLINRLIKNKIKTFINKLSYTLHRNLWEKIVPNYKKIYVMHGFLPTYIYERTVILIHFKRHKINKLI